MEICRLLNGKTIGLDGMSADEHDYLHMLQEKVQAGATYDELTLLITQQGSLPRRFPFGPLYEVAQAIVDRVGITEGRILPPVGYKPAPRLVSIGSIKH